MWSQVRTASEAHTQTCDELDQQLASASKRKEEADPEQKSDFKTIAAPGPAQQDIEERKITGTESAEASEPEFESEPASHQPSRVSSLEVCFAHPLIAAGCAC